MNTDLDPKLLNTWDEKTETFNSAFPAPGQIKGYYSPSRFVVKLDPRIHKLLEEVGEGIHTKEIPFDNLQASSTYLHECIHWWQHIGSTSGLIQSLAFPAQSHANYKHLKSLLKESGAKKSVLESVKQSVLALEGTPHSPAQLANIITNNFYDIESFRVSVTDISLIRTIANDVLFECMGHSAYMTYSNVLAVLASTFDNDFKSLPDPREWEIPFRMLRDKKVDGYFHGSDIFVGPVALRELFEGQARFCQMQYLYYATGRKCDWTDFWELGMFDGVYGKAFEQFIKLTGVDLPTSFGDPVIALFLMVCDLSINPTAGFPEQIQNFETFLNDVQPGFRFLKLCTVISEDVTYYESAILGCTRQEYIQVSSVLGGKANFGSPIEILERMAEWKSRSSEIRDLLSELESFLFRDGNQPVRLVFAHFLSFNEDKLRSPEFFCWPGAWMAGDRVSKEVHSLYERHSPIFVGKPDVAGIFPRKQTGRDEKNVQKAFETFYAYNAVYEITRQWIWESGPFKFDFGWLSAKGSNNDYRAFADRHFKQIFGIDTSEFQII